jgi:cation diffusion facilitator CzcD-associated flavoprotein CzcO
MAGYDVVVIGAGLGGLIAGAILARAGRKVLVIERSNSVGGAASSYKVGDLFVEGSLHETSSPMIPAIPSTTRWRARACWTRSTGLRPARSMRRAAARSILPWFCRTTSLPRGARWPTAFPKQAPESSGCWARWKASQRRWARWRAAAAPCEIRAGRSARRAAQARSGDPRLALVIVAKARRCFRRP